MKFLAIDIGTGTQDVFLFDSRLDIENAVKLVLPSPTMRVRQQIFRASQQGLDIALDGVIMGGGPSTWAVEEHLRRGYQVFATLEAAKTFDDDPDKIKNMGIQLISDDELAALPSSVKRIQTRDLDIESIEQAFSIFDVSLNDLSLLAVCVFDHGCAPVNVSDRKFRFDYLDRTIRALNRLSAFAYPSMKIPSSLTRMQAVAKSAHSLPFPLLVMDSAPAAVLGALMDPYARKLDRSMVVNIGNGHTLGFRLSSNRIEGVFEHHTGFLDSTKLDSLLREFATGSLKNDQIFADHGHGALIYTNDPLPLDHNDFNLIVTGPRQSMMAASSLKPHFATPFGDMMMAGCFGLLAAAADHFPQFADEIHESLLHSQSKMLAPWDLID